MTCESQEIQVISDWFLVQARDSSPDVWYYFFFHLSCQISFVNSLATFFAFFKVSIVSISFFSILVDMRMEFLSVGWKLCLRPNCSIILFFSIFIPFPTHTAVAYNSLRSSSLSSLSSCVRFRSEAPPIIGISLDNAPALSSHSSPLKSCAVQMWVWCSVQHLSILSIV